MTGFPGSGGENDIGIPLLQQLLRRMNLLPQDKLDTQCPTELHILLNRLIRNPESWDHMADNSSQLFPSFEYSDRYPFSRQEVGSREPGGATSHNGYLEARPWS